MVARAVAWGLRHPALIIPELLRPLSLWYCYRVRYPASVWRAAGSPRGFRPHAPWFAGLVLVLLRVTRSL